MGILQVRLTEEELAALKVQAASQHMTMTDLVKRWIDTDPLRDLDMTTVIPIPAGDLSNHGKKKQPETVVNVPTPVKSTPPRPTGDSYAAFRPVPKPGTKR